MPGDFLIARNPEPDSRLPYLLRIPLGDGLVVKARDTWPRTSAVYCHPVDGAVERKSPADLVTSITTGRLGYQLADLAAIPRAAVAVEDRYAAVFKLDRVRPATVADAIAELAVRWPSVPIIFCDTRALAEEWTYRFLAAAHMHADDDQHAAILTGGPPGITGPAAPAPTTAEIRAWARTAGLTVPDRGRLRPDIVTAYRDAHTPPPEPS